MDELVLDIYGLKIAVKTWGDPANKPVLALHGWLDNAASFDLLAPLLTEKYYIVAPDLAGHGRSGHLPETVVYHYVDGVVQVQHIINCLKWKSYCLLGHSMGSGIASLLAGITPDAIEHAWFIEVLGAATRPEEDAVIMMHHYFESIHHERPHHHYYDTYEEAIEARTKSGFIDYKAASILAARGVMQQDGKFFWNHDPRLVLPSPLYLTENQILSFLKNIKAPCDFILAENGFPFLKKLAESRCKAIPNLKTHTIPGGHHCHMENPQAVADVMMRG